MIYISVQILRLLSRIRLTSMRYLGNEIERCSFVSCWLPSNSELRVTGIRRFEKIYISHFGPYCMYHYFHEDTNYAVLFKDMAPKRY